MSFSGLKITIAYKHDESQFKRVKGWILSNDLERFSTQFPQFEPIVERGAFTQIECSDEIGGAKLLHKVNALLESR